MRFNLKNEKHKSSCLEKVLTDMAQRSLHVKECRSGTHVRAHDLCLARPDESRPPTTPVLFVCEVKRQIGETAEWSTWKSKIWYIKVTGIPCL